MTRLNRLWVVIQLPPRRTSHGTVGGADRRAPCSSSGTIRTYKLVLDPASYLDARRHRILGTERLVHDRPAYLAKLPSGVALRDSWQSRCPVISPCS